MDDLLYIGVLGAPFGVRGQIKLHSISSHPEHLIRHLRTVFIGPKRIPHQVTRLFLHKPGLLIIQLQSVTDRDTASDLRGAEVYIAAADAAPLGEDEFFYHDLIGLAAVTDTGDLIGEVRDVLETGAGEIAVIARRGRADALVPMVRDFIVAIDLVERRLVIRPIDGLLD
ncbi:MAG: ribosome maturation factor RimM [Chloroflexus sp.]|jgi:16S rRNA processing protein RimM|uniref:ribosome maturation factor RimM n=1 Tax=Chloroflexus sp. TaxID=1904827 RepID=UPI0021DE0718|nr:ribosome maturation factor RimM [Chloroflexus sp.]GIV88128.1 MAG: ribosome maturation factor RimM [Chloroflexus sp.]